MKRIPLKAIYTGSNVTSLGEFTSSDRISTEYIELSDVVGNIIPAANITYNLGNSLYRFKDIFLSGNSIHLGSIILKEIGTGLSITDENGNVIFSGNTTAGVSDVAGAVGSVSNAQLASGISLATIANLTVSGNIDVSGVVDGRDISVDGSKLDTIASGAEVNQNAFSSIAVAGESTVSADSKTDTLTLVAGTNVTIATDAANDTITISANDTSVDWSEITNKPDPVVTVTLTGDVTGTGNTTLSDLANGTITVSTTVVSDSIVLGADTTGDFVQNVLAGTGVQITGQGGENSTPTVALTNTGVVANTYGGSTTIPIITFDAQGRATSASNVSLDSYITASSINTLTNKTFDVSIASNNKFSIQSNDITSYSGYGSVVILQNSPTISVLNLSDSNLNIDGGTGSYYWAGQSGVAQVGDLKAGVYSSDPNSKNSLFTFGNNGANTMSISVEGSLFIGTAMPSNNGGLNTTYPGWLVVQSGAKFGGDIDTLGGLNLTDPTNGDITFPDGSVQNTAYKTSVLTTANVTELTNLYYTNARVYANVVQLNYATTSQLTQAYDQANTATTNASSAFDSSNTKVATVAGVTATTISNAQLGAGIVSTTLSNLTISGDINVGGNLNLTGNVTTFTANDLIISDPLIYIGEDNTGDVLDLGFIASFTNTGYQHTGLVRDATDGKWKLFANVIDEPSTTVNFTNATYSTLKLGAVEADTATFTGNVSTGNVSATAGTFTYSKLGTVQTGTWQGTSISTAYTDAKITEVAGQTGSISNAQLAAGVQQTGIFNTSNVVEGSNLYYTDDRVYSNVSLIGYATNTNVALKANVVDLTTANVTELTNLYYTNARVYANVVAAGFYDTVSNTAPIGASEAGTTLTLTHLDSGVNASTYGGSDKIPVLVVNSSGHITSASNVTTTVANTNITGNIISSQITPMTSSEFSALITDETGTGSVVLANSPTLTTPNIGAASGSSLSLNSVVLLQSAELTTTSPTQATLATFSANVYGAGEILIQANRGDNRHISKLLVCHDNITAIATEFGTLATGGELFTANVDISSGDVRILVTPDSGSSTNFKASISLIRL